MRQHEVDEGDNGEQKIRERSACLPKRRCAGLLGFKDSSCSDVLDRIYCGSNLKIIQK